MRINPILYGILVLTVFFCIILGFQAAGIWSISGKVSASGEAIQPAATDVNTIKGWMTLEQIAATYNVPLADLLEKFSLPADTPPTTAIKDLENETFDVTGLRDWLQSQMSSAATPTPGEQPLEPEPAIPATSGSVPTPTPVITATVHAEADKTMTGKTTFQNLLDWGVSIENIQKVIAGDLPSPSMLVKDYATNKARDFASLKTALQAEVDKVK